MAVKTSWAAGDVLTAADLTDTFGSKAATADFPAGAWTSYTPTYTNITVGNATVTARYVQLGKLVHVSWAFTVGSTTTFAAAQAAFSLPVTASSTNFGWLTGYFSDVSANTTYSVVAGIEPSATTASLGVMNASATYLTIAALTSTVPVAPATSDVLKLTGFYTAA